MLRRLVRAFLSLLGAAFGAGVAVVIIIFLNSLNINVSLANELIIYLACGTIFSVVLFITSPRIVTSVITFTKKVEEKLSEIPIDDIVFGSIGLIVGLFISYLLSGPIEIIGNTWLSLSITIGIYFILGYLGISIAVKRREELNVYAFFKKSTKQKSQKETYGGMAKILDTSVIIDGRIFDICKTGFIEGPLIIPNFVLEELRHIADSSDSLKRNRGRRGLDILNSLQKELDIEVLIYEGDFPDIQEVDSKLLKLGQELDAKVVTNDYNLNKVAEFQGVAVLNINELANAIKPIVLPGEEMSVQVIKDGKENGQGVAYLDDGTMIVVDGGKKFVGEHVDVLVTSVLQTSAGRMIFAKPKQQTA